jgi:hypothetical protein
LGFLVNLKEVKATMQNNNPPNQNQGWSKPDPAQLFQDLNSSDLIKNSYYYNLWLDAVRTGSYTRIASTLKTRRTLVKHGMRKNQLKEMSLQIDPFHPRPTNDVFYGDVFMGHILNPLTQKPMSYFRLSLDELLRHGALFGGTGIGKTNSSVSICANILKTYGDDVKIIIIDPKKSYRQHLHPNFITLNFDDFKDEMFERPTEHIPQHKWNNKIIDKMGSEMYFQITSKNQLLKIIAHIMSYSRNPYPTHDEIIRVGNIAIKEKGLDIRRREAIGTVVDRFEALQNHAKYCKNVSIPIEEIMNQNIIFEVDEDTAEIAAFRLGLLITKIYTTKKYDRDYGKSYPTTIILYDEARQQLAERKSDFDSPILDSLLPLIREFEIGFILSTQEPTSISRVARANTFTKIAFPLFDGEDDEVICKSFNLNETQAEYYRQLSGLPIGNGIVRYGKYPTCFPIYIQKINDMPFVTPDEIEERKSEFLDRFIIPQEIPIPISADSQEAKKIIDINSIPPDAIIILKTLEKSPFLNFTSLLKKANLSSTSAILARDWLETNKYLTQERLRVNKSGKKSLFLELTEKTYAALQTNKPYSGKVSFTHRIYANLVASKLRADKWDVTIEAITEKSSSQHKMDILAMKHGENFDYEITISTANVEDNIINGFQDNRITKVIIVADRKTLQECKNKTAHLMVEYEGRIEFKPISDFF